MPFWPTFEFNLTTFQISVTTQNSTIASDLPEYLPGTVAILTATPSAGYIFSNWAGDATGSINPGSVVMNSDKTITAAFSADTGDDDGLTSLQEIVAYGTNPDNSNIIDGLFLTLEGTLPSVMEA